MRSIVVVFLLVVVLAACDQKNEQSAPSATVTKESVQVLQDTSNFGQTTKPKSAAAQRIKQQSDSLVRYYTVANAGEANEKYERLFFDSFPSTFKEMNDIFGYSEEVGASPLYEYPIGHNIIQFFKNLTTIPKEEYYKKYIGICVGGVWEADNIQTSFGFADKLLGDTKAASSALAKHTDEEIKSVFRFIFDGPHPDNEVNQEIYRKLLPAVSKQDKRLGELLTTSYTEVIQSYDEHGH